MSTSNARGPKAEIAALSREAVNGIITTETASRSLGASRASAARVLARLMRAGWLGRVRRGTYLILPLEASSAAQTTLPDPWVAASVLYAPCYIAGWSAAEHWSLTEQLFRSTFVATAANIRARDEDLLGATFHLAKVKRARIDELTTVWRSGTRVLVSGLERTIVDAGVTPAWLGGARHLGDVIVAYSSLRTASSAALAEQLRNYGNGAAAKRIGFLAERLWPEATDLVSECLARRSRGNVKLDPAVPARGRLLTRWGLWENVRLGDASHS